MSILRLFFVLTVAILSSGCAKKTSVPKVKKAKAVAQQERKPILRQFNAIIEGVECAICAQDVVNMFKGMAGVDSADFVVKNGDYEQGHLRFYFDVSEGNIDLRKCDELLQSQGFELASLKGAFYIDPFSSDGKKYVALNDDVALPFSYTHVDVLKKMIATKRDKLFAEGVIEKDPQDDVYCFTLLGQA